MRESFISNHTVSISNYLNSFEVRKFKTQNENITPGFNQQESLIKKHKNQRKYTDNNSYKCDIVEIINDMYLLKLQTENVLHKYVDFVVELENKVHYRGSITPNLNKQTNRDFSALKY